MTMLRAGADPRDVYAMTWPTSPPMPFDAFLQMWRDLEVADATTLPPTRLGDGLEDVVDALHEARGSIMKALRSGCDAGDKGFDKSVHDALCKNAETLLKVQDARREQQAHALNLKASQARARIELRALLEKE